MVSIKCFSLVACFLMADVFYGFVGGAALREGACRLMMLVRPMSPFCFGEREMVRYEHDCSDCISLGEWGRWDLYFCSSGNASIPTLLARFGNEAYDYISGLGSVIAPLVEARRRAKEKGLFVGLSSLSE